MLPTAKRRFFISVAAIVLLASPLAWSEIYSWVDENGKKHFGDKIPPEYQDQASPYELSEINTSEAVEVQKQPSSSSSSTGSSRSGASSGSLDRPTSSGRASSCEVAKQEYQRSLSCYANCRVLVGGVNNISRCGNCKNVKKPNC
jgi:hypothetical protein